jgi:calcineurin-like phosphoesterase family protein
MQTYITSDLHFGQRSILNYCAHTRGKYLTVDGMTVGMIAEWNSTVQPEDFVYILGDVSFYNLPRTVEILNALNGSKFLVAGNHDRSFRDRGKFKACFVNIVDYHTFTYKKEGLPPTRLVMMHYPILDWYGMMDGSVHLFGHLHGRRSPLDEYRAVDVGVDATGKVVSKLDDIVRLALQKKVKLRTRIEDELCQNELASRELTMN